MDINLASLKALVVSFTNAEPCLLGRGCESVAPHEQFPEGAQILGATCLI